MGTSTVCSKMHSGMLTCGRSLMTSEFSSTTCGRRTSTICATHLRPTRCCTRSCDVNQNMRHWEIHTLVHTFPWCHQHHHLLPSNCSNGVKLTTSTHSFKNLRYWKTNTLLHTFLWCQTHHLNALGQNLRQHRHVVAHVLVVSTSPPQHSDKISSTGKSTRCCARSNGVKLTTSTHSFKIPGAS